MAAASYDLAVVGAGILGLAHALIAAQRGRRVAVFEADQRATGASLRNFGFVTVTGQESGVTWDRARRSREVWAAVAEAAGIEVLHRGTLLAARRPEALAVLEAFTAGPMGAACELITPADAYRRFPVLRRNGLAGCLWSPHELRVEARDALPRLATYLERAHDVTFHWSTRVRSVEPPILETTRGRFAAEACVVCPGSDDLGLFAERLAAYGLQRCKLQMLRLAPQPPDWRLPGSVMSDLSLVRYRGFSALPQAAALERRLIEEAPDALAHGIHLIVVQSADGSLVVGDSHHTAVSPDPFAASEVEDIILREAFDVLDIADRRVTERWTGIYPTASDRAAVIDAPAEGVRIAIVTGGTGMSTAFGLAQEVIGELYGDEL